MSKNRSSQLLIISALIIHAIAYFNRPLFHVLANSYQPRYRACMMLKPITLLAAIAALSLSGCGDSTRDQRMAQAGPKPDLEALLKVADPEIGAKKYRSCGGCHHIKKGASDLGGPNLYGVYNQPTAQSGRRFGFTAALRDSGLIWDAKTLDRWIENPKNLVPSTSMQYSGIQDPLDRADIIAFIRTRRDQAAN